MEAVVALGLQLLLGCRNLRAKCVLSVRSPSISVQHVPLNSGDATSQNFQSKVLMHALAGTGGAMSLPGVSCVVIMKLRSWMSR